MRTFDRVTGLAVTTASAIASTALLIYFLRTPTFAGDVIWPSVLIASVATVAAWTGVWAWANERWAIAAPAIFIGSIGAAGFMSFLTLVPMCFAGVALCRAIKRKLRTA